MAKAQIQAVSLAVVLIAGAIALTALFAHMKTRDLAPTDVTRELIGRSVRGHPIYAYELGNRHGLAVLVVGSIHGNERGGVAVVIRLLEMKPPKKNALWVIPTLNPDGYAARTRQNAHGVDLNRNFPSHWRRLTGSFFSGQRRLSEPESRAAYRLITRLRPRISIWLHQSLGVVDMSQGSHALERRFGRLAGLRLKRLPDYPGSATVWENSVLPDGTAFVVELPRGRLTARSVARYAGAVMDVVNS